MREGHLLVLGLGYVGAAVARAAAEAGMAVTGTARAEEPPALAGIAIVPFGAAAPAIGQATHLLVTAPPGAAGDPVLLHHGAAITAAPRLRWIGYVSSTAVYGDRGGAWVDEAAAPAPSSARGRQRLAAEQTWRAAAPGKALDLFRTAGIYGPGRSPFAELRAGRGRRVVRPGHAFSRIHRDDIVQAVMAAMRQQRPDGARVLHLADDFPAESAAVVEEAARLLGVAAPPAMPFAAAWAAMSPMAQSFWAENRRIDSARTQAMLGIRWRYPSYREGLRAILAEESGEGAA